MTARPTFDQARMLAAQGRWIEARNALEQAALDPARHRDAGLLAAQCDFATGRAEEGLRRLADLCAFHPADARLRFESAAMAFDSRRWEDVDAHARACLQLEPGHFGAWLLRGFALEERGLVDASLGALLRAVRFAERADPRQLPPAFRHGLAEASRRVRDRLREVLDACLEPVARHHGEKAVTRLRKGAEMFAGFRAADFAHPLWRPGLFYIPDLPPRMFFEREEFAWVPTAEAAWRDIRDELDACLSADDPASLGFAPYVDHQSGTHEAKIWSEINRSERWSVLHFYRHGQRREDAHTRCPATSAILESIELQRIPGYGPEAMFSLLHPRTRIPAHYGSVNGRLIVHLPLVVPPRCGGIRVGSETRTWQEGRILAFDDSFEHEAWNDSDALRSVLIFDTWNPFLDQGEREATIAVLVAVQGFEEHLLASLAAD